MRSRVVRLCAAFVATLALSHIIFFDLTVYLSVADSPAANVLALIAEMTTWLVVFIAVPHDEGFPRVLTRQLVPCVTIPVCMLAPFLVSEGIRTEYVFFLFMLGAFAGYGVGSFLERRLRGAWQKPLAKIHSVVSYVCQSPRLRRVVIGKRVIKGFSALTVSTTSAYLTYLTVLLLLRLAAPDHRIFHEPNIFAAFIGVVVWCSIVGFVPGDLEANIKVKGKKALTRHELLRFWSRQGAFYLLISLGIVLPYPVLCYVGSHDEGFLIFLGIMGGVIGYTAARCYLGTPKPSVLINRGREVWRDPAKLAIEFARNEEYLESIGDSGIQVGGARIETDAAKGHFLIIGATRTGKSIIMWALIRSVLKKFVRGGDQRAVILDSKQNAISILAAIPGFRVVSSQEELDQAEAQGFIAIVTLNPFEARCFSWAVARDIRSRAGARRLASLLAPHNPKLSQQHWDETLRQLITEVVVVFIRNPFTRDVWTLRDVIYALTNKERAIAVLSQTSSGRDTIQMARKRPGARVKRHGDGPSKAW